MLVDSNVWPDLGLADEDGKTPLMLAVKQSLGMVWLILQYGADRNINDHDGNAVFDYPEDNKDPI